MKPTVRTALLALGLAALAATSTATRAADVSRQDILSLFELQQIDKNHDKMVTKKEFMDMMSKAWDMEAESMKAKSGMTLEQYKAFASMFNLNVGG